MSIEANPMWMPPNSMSGIPSSLLGGDTPSHLSGKSPCKINELLHRRRGKQWSQAHQCLDTSPTRYPPPYMRHSPTCSPSVSPTRSQLMPSHLKYPTPTRSMASSPTSSSTSSPTSSPTSVRSYGYDTPELRDVDYYPCYDFLTSDRNVDVSAMIYSRATYGMLRQTLEKIMEAQPDAWVVCVRYKQGDTQICFGGKVPVDVSNVDACIMESKEEARLVYPQSALRFENHGKVKNTIHTIYSVNVSDCSFCGFVGKSVKPDTFNKVGVVVHGQFEEIINLLDEYKQEQHRELNDDISAVVAIPIKIAATFAPYMKDCVPLDPSHPMQT